jgi:hypothetical protein
LVLYHIFLEIAEGKLAEMKTVLLFKAIKRTRKILIFVV